MKKLTQEQLQFAIAAINGAPIQGTDGAKTKGELLIAFSVELEGAMAPPKEPKSKGK
jgi:hypothetical protein